MNRGGTREVAMPEPDAGAAGAARRVFAEGEVDSDARPALRLQPRYPEHARLMGLESDVKLLVTVEADGRVSQVEVLSSGGEDFDREAQEALLRARFVAARKGGEAVAALVGFTVRFRLDD
jgi:protein TonB